MLLSVTLDNQEIRRLVSAPVEERVTVRLTSPHPILSFIDVAGTRYNHDLSSVVREGSSWLHLFVRVHAEYACQADALLCDVESVPADACGRGLVKGMRFQPFYLPQCQASPAALVGQGLFFRGLHFPGTVTPGNVSLSCICDACRKSFRLQSFHAGFGQQAYFYCSNAPHTLVMSAFVDGAPGPLSQPNAQALLGLERRLPACAKCGGRFDYWNPLRCPHCRQPYIDFARHPTVRANEYYGNHLYGDDVQHWDEPI